MFAPIKPFVRVSRILGLSLCVSAGLTGCFEPKETKRIQPPIKIKAISKPVTDLVRSELIHTEVNTAFKNRFIRGIKNRDTKRMIGGFSKHAQIQFPRPKKDDFAREGIMSYWLSSFSSSVVESPATFAAALHGVLSEWAEIEIAEWHVFALKARARRPSDRVVQKGHLSLAGVTRSGERQEISATLTMELVRTEIGHWRIKTLLFDEQTWTRIAGAGFRDIAAATGFQFNTSEKNKQLQQAVINQRHLFTNGGLTALDFNKDGFWDILATLVDQETILFVNDGKGGFSRQHFDLLNDRAKASKFYAWIDLDNDGHEELIGERVLKSKNGKHDIGLYTFKKGKMRQVPQALQFETEKWMHKISFESIVPCDINGDQLLDLIFVGYSHNDSNRQPSFISATDGMRNLIFINQGKLQFKEEGRQRGLEESKYSLVAACHDFDADGDFDLFVGNDFGNNDYYENLGSGNFRANREHPFHQGSSFSMGLSIADYDNRGDYAVSVSNMYSHAGNRIVPLAGEFKAHGTNEILRLAAGNSLFERVHGKWHDTGQGRKINVSGWAWGNQFFDFDNDGDKDLFVTNGNNTHSDPHLPDF
jgi:hypothetical protein